jgi:hypothetical protein
VREEKTELTQAANSSVHIINVETTSTPTMKEIKQCEFRLSATGFLTIEAPLEELVIGELLSRLYQGLQTHR